MSKIYLGPAGWNYPDWQGTVYPQHYPKGFSELHFIANFFDTVEVNSSFYRIPSAKNAQSWLQQVQHNIDFKFCVKLWQNFTHTEFTPASAQVAAFQQAVTPLAEANRLGALLVQFPWRFKLTNENVAQLKNILQAFQDFPCAVEFRHSSWLHDKIYEILANYQCSFVNIDQPVIGESIPPTVLQTSSTGYVRFHGRNYANWFKEGSDRNTRYDYLYQQPELQSWMENLQQLDEKTDSTYVVFNNHFRGQAIVNAFQLQYLLTGEKVKAPSHLVNVYHSLQGISIPDDAGQTLNLF